MALHPYRVMPPSPGRADDTSRATTSGRALPESAAGRGGSVETGSLPAGLATDRRERPGRTSPLKRTRLPGGAPLKAGAILATLIIVAAVANLPLAMANVALPTIGNQFDASQIQLNSLPSATRSAWPAPSCGLARSVTGTAASSCAPSASSSRCPAAIIAGFAPSIEVLIGARLLGGFAAGMAYPTTLSLIAALWAPGPGRTRAIALWAAVGGAISVSGPLLAGLLLEAFDWPAVFLIVLPLAVIALVLTIRNIPAHIHESTEAVDNLGGILSVVVVGAFILGINFVPVPSERALAVGLLGVAAVALVLFLVRQRRAENPLFDLRIAARPTFWVAAVGGIIVFGALMGACSSASSSSRTSSATRPSRPARPCCQPACS